mmetsp:Transcript_145415/g.264658  ORF Transcript_145415/g.264658 Transcript_145415/m.264658 type:complete len:115 (+) Transcript_145415:153-497(+)
MQRPQLAFNFVSHFVGHVMLVLLLVLVPVLVLVLVKLTYLKAHSAPHMDVGATVLVFGATVSVYCGRRINRWSPFPLRLSTMKQTRATRTEINKHATNLRVFWQLAGVAIADCD